MFPLRVVTYNIRGGLGMDGERNIRRIGEYLAKLDADIYCLQEVHDQLPQSGMVDQPSILSKCLGLPCYFSSALQIGGGRYGIATFSRLPILSVCYVRLPNIRERLRGTVWREKRTALVLELDLNGCSISITNTHWSLNAKDRASSAPLLAESARGHPRLIVGDFNSSIGSTEIKSLLSVSDTKDADWLANTPTFPSDHPNQRIDLVLHSNEFKVSVISVESVLFSDHLPVVVDFLFHVKQDGTEVTE